MKEETRGKQRNEDDGFMAYTGVGKGGGFSNNSRPRISFHPEPKETHVAETESQSWVKRKREKERERREGREREGHLTDICDDIREDCLTIKKGWAVCMQSC